MKQSVWRAICQKKMVICLLNGFTAGLPYFYLFQLIPGWLRDQGIDLKSIGLLGLVGISYNWKFVWSPLMDRFQPPLGRRRGWLLMTQIPLFLSLLGFSLCDPHRSIQPIVWLALLTAFFSASQDVVLDAYRREILLDEELGLGNSMYTNAYRIAGFIPGGLSIILADHIPWSMVHVVTACFMFVGIGMTLWIAEPAIENLAPPKNLKNAIVLPFKEFFQRSNVKAGLLLLAFFFFYKFGDILATALQTPFFLDVGFTKTVIGSVVKVSGVISSLVGALIGGIIIFKIGINRSLWIFGFTQIAAICGFAILSVVGPKIVALGIVVSLDYFCFALGSAALIAFMAKNTSKNFTATQFALFSSLILVPRTFSGLLAGVLIEGFHNWAGFSWAGLGYTRFFFVCVAAALPGMLLLNWVAPWGKEKQGLDAPVVS